jgi:hypothetical protein
MALVNVYPNYMNFSNLKESEEYPVEYYSNFLNYVKENYEGKYWNVLPNQVAKFSKTLG